MWGSVASGAGSFRRTARRPATGRKPGGSPAPPSPKSPPTVGVGRVAPPRCARTIGRPRRSIARTVSRGASVRRAGDAARGHGVARRRSKRPSRDRRSRAAGVAAGHGPARALSQGALVRSAENPMGTPPGGSARPAGPTWSSRERIRLRAGDRSPDRAGNLPIGRSGGSIPDRLVRLSGEASRSLDHRRRRRGGRERLPAHAAFAYRRAGASPPTSRRGPIVRLDPPREKVGDRRSRDPGRSRARFRRIPGAEP